MPDYTDPCTCRRCEAERNTGYSRGVDLGAAGAALFSSRFYMCPICGNKRCPHATDHREACTKSNEPGQPGSIYG